MITEEFKMLHKKCCHYIQATGHAAFGCQRHYAQVLITEFDLDNVNSITPTFTKATKPVRKIVPKNTSSLKNKFNI